MFEFLKVDYDFSSKATLC